MDKLEKLKQAEQFILKDTLYGTISNIRVKDFLESRVEELVRDEETVEELAHRINFSLDNINGDDKLYVEAHKSYESPTYDENNYINRFIESIPYKGEILFNNELINIEDYLRKQNINGPLDSLYRQILINEPIKVSYIDKEEIVKDTFNALSHEHEDINDFLYNDKQFQSEIAKLPSMLNDRFEITIEDKIYSLEDYLNKLYSGYSERKYNSVESKPTLVETIGITRGEKDLEVTSSYVFLSDDEMSSLVNNNYSYTDEDKIRDIYIGLEASDSSSLSLYDDQIKEIAGNNSPLSSMLVKTYLNKKRSIDVVKDNNDDLELIVDNSLNELQSDLNDIKRDYKRLYSLDKSRNNELLYKLNETRANAFDMDINMSSKIDQIQKSDDALSIISNYSMNNVDHNKEAVLFELNNQKNIIEDNIRSMNNSSKNTEKTGLEVRIMNLRNKYNKFLGDNISYLSKEDIDKYIDESEEYKRRAA